MDRLLEFAGNHTLLVFALVTSFMLVIFTELRRKATGMMAVQPTDAVKLINNDAVVLDMRSAESFSRGHIVGARNVPMDELTGHLDKLAPLLGHQVAGAQTGNQYVVCHPIAGQAHLFFDQYRTGVQQKRAAHP